VTWRNAHTRLSENDLTSKMEELMLLSPPNEELLIDIEIRVEKQFRCSIDAV